MPHIVIDGKSIEAPTGTSILECARRAGIEVPSLCHDQRLQPYGGCRLCLVRIEGQDKPVTACSTMAQDHMSVATNTPEIEELRKTLLQLLANHYPAEASERYADKDFHHWLRIYGVQANSHRTKTEWSDGSHPYIAADMSRCILCSRCIRICDQVQGQFVWKLWNRGDRSCILPDSEGSLLSSSCVSCGACVDACPTGALEDKSMLNVSSPLQWTRTTCPYCGVGCELRVGSSDGQIRVCKPVLDAPVSKGHLCSKGRYAFGFVAAPDRILQPMLRKNGTRQIVSWDHAIAATAAALKSTAERYGPDSIGILGSARATNEENYLAQKFARLVAGTNNIDCCARVCHAPSAAALKQAFASGVATNSFDDIELARTIVVWGANPTANHPVVGARIKQAVLQGARLIVVDPRLTELCNFAEVHLQLRPGTDGDVLNAMACSVIQENLIDLSFVQDRVKGYAEFERFVDEFSPESVAAASGLDAALIRRAARIYATSRPGICFHGLGLTEHVEGTDAVGALINLALLTGNIGKSGTGINPLRGQNNVQGAAHMGCDPDFLTGSIPIADAPLFERVWGENMPRQQGLNLLQMMDAAGDSRLKLLWVIGYDILLTNPNTSTVRSALQKLDAVIVQDMFLNETAKEFGTIFLPACSSFEKDGTFMNAERRIQRVRQALPPLGESRADWQIICAVAKSMGAGNHFQFASAEEIWEEIRKVWSNGAGITYDRLEAGGLQWPCPNRQHPGTSILYADTFPIGERASLSCVKFAPSTETTSSEYPFILITGRALQQFNAGTMTQRTQHAVLHEKDLLDLSPHDAANLGIAEGELVKITSRYGEAILFAHLTNEVAPGQAFSTFHNSRTSLNCVTGPFRDKKTSTPAYKVTAVNISRLAGV